MSIKSFFVIASALLASVAVAQESLGTVGNVQGLVTDSDGKTVSSTVTGETIQDGERFVTSSSGSVTLNLNNGCTITLQPNQAVSIDKRKTCSDLIAAITPVGGTAIVAGGGQFGRGLVSIAGLTVGAFAFHNALDLNPRISAK